MKPADLQEVLDRGKARFLLLRDLGINTAEATDEVRLLAALLEETDIRGVLIEAKGLYAQSRNTVLSHRANNAICTLVLALLIQTQRADEAMAPAQTD